jgi:hypothetical protein
VLLDYGDFKEPVFLMRHLITMIFEHVSLNDLTLKMLVANYYSRTYCIFVYNRHVLCATIIIREYTMLESIGRILVV